MPQNVPTSILVSTKNLYTAAIRYVLVATISPHDENNTTEEAHSENNNPSGRNAIVMVKEELSVWSKGVIVASSE